MQTLSQTVADHAHRWGEIPNIGPFDGRGHNENSRGVVVAGIAIVAQTPTRPRSNDPVRTLNRVKSKHPKRTSLCTSNDIRQAELGPTQSVKRAGYRSIVVLH